MPLQIVHEELQGRQQQVVTSPERTTRFCRGCLRKISRVQCSPAATASAAGGWLIQAMLVSV
jgi:hypothetical protein